MNSKFTVLTVFVLCITNAAVADPRLYAPSQRELPIGILLGDECRSNLKPFTFGSPSVQEELQAIVDRHSAVHGVRTEEWDGVETHQIVLVVELQCFGSNELDDYKAGEDIFAVVAIYMGWYTYRNGDWTAFGEEEELWRASRQAVDRGFDFPLSMRLQTFADVNGMDASDDVWIEDFDDL